LPKGIGAKAGSSPLTEYNEQTKKWSLSNYNGDANLSVDAKSPGDSISVHNCSSSVLKVNGKITNISVAGCLDCGFVLDSVISGFESVNCKKLQIEARQSIPQIMLDKSQSVTIYLSAESLTTQIITSLTEEVNVVVPRDGEEDLELAIPVQFLTRLVGGRLVTGPTEHV